MTHLEGKIRKEKHQIRKLERKIKVQEKVERREKKFKEKHFRAGFETSLRERRVKA